MSGSQRYRAAHKGTGRQTNDTGRRTKGIEGNRNELNAVHIQLWPPSALASACAHGEPVPRLHDSSVGSAFM